MISRTSKSPYPILSRFSPTWCLGIPSIVKVRNLYCTFGHFLYLNHYELYIYILQLQKWTSNHQIPHPAEGYTISPTLRNKGINCSWCLSVLGHLQNIPAQHLCFCFLCDSAVLSQMRQDCMSLSTVGEKKDRDVGMGT